MLTLETKTYSASLSDDGICTVGGLHAADIALGCNRGRALDRQKSLREDIQRGFFEMTPGPDDLRGIIHHWEMA